MCLQVMDSPDIRPHECRLVVIIFIENTCVRREMTPGGPKCAHGPTLMAFLSPVMLVASIMSGPRSGSKVGSVNESFLSLTASVVCCWSCSGRVRRPGTLDGTVTNLDLVVDVRGDDVVVPDIDGAEAEAALVGNRVGDAVCTYVPQ
jgi:hypothetical protein